MICLYIRKVKYYNGSKYRFDQRSISLRLSCSILEEYFFLDGSVKRPSYTVVPTQQSLY